MFRKKLMKSFLLASLLLTLGFTISGCGQEPTPTEEYTIDDYYPYNENVKMAYEGQGSEFASYTTYVDYITDGKIQIRTNNGGTEFVTILQNSEGALTQAYIAEETYYKADFTNETANESLVLLKEPLKQGTKWDVSDGSQREITGVSVAIETPYKSFDTLEVTIIRDGQITGKEYYALDFGLIKSVIFFEGEEITSSLEEMVTGAGYDFPVRSYNFFVTDTDILSNFADKKVSLKTNQSINDFFEIEFLEGQLISANTVINDLWVKPGSNVANIDFSKHFVSEMNAGTTNESGILMSVANTVGNYFQVQKVIITLDGEPYSSGHILMKEGEAFDTTYQNEVAD